MSQDNFILVWGLMCAVCWWKDFPPFKVLLTLFTFICGVCAIIIATGVAQP